MSCYISFKFQLFKNHRGAHRRTEVLFVLKPFLCVPLRASVFIIKCWFKANNQEHTQE